MFIFINFNIRIISGSYEGYIFTFHGGMNYKVMVLCIIVVYIGCQHYIANPIRNVSGLCFIIVSVSNQITFCTKLYCSSVTEDAYRSSCATYIYITITGSYSTNSVINGNISTQGYTTCTGSYIQRIHIAYGVELNFVTRVEFQTMGITSQSSCATAKGYISICGISGCKVSVRKQCYSSRNVNRSCSCYRTGDVNHICSINC